MSKSHHLMSGLLLLMGISVSAIAQDADPYLWLEEVSSEKALAWVQHENSKTVSVLEGDARRRPVDRPG